MITAIISVLLKSWNSLSAGVTLTIFGQGFIKAHLYRVRHIFYLGTALNVFCVSGMLVLVFHPMLARSILVKGLDLLEKCI